MKRSACTATTLAFLTAATTHIPLDSGGADWPQWRYDAARTAASPQELAGTLHLQWVREYPALEPAWQDPVNRDRMPYDRAYEPVVLGSRMFIGSSRNDSVTALDTRSGRQLWRIHVDGPVRLPPVAAADKVFFVSDDGYLYCVDATDGALVWKYRGGPSNRRILGNSRLVSAWPARGGPVLVDGTIYFAASLWPFEGVFIHALDTETGKILWTNDRTGAMFIDQPHDAPAFGGLAPQGAIAAVGDRLLVPGGRSVPACLDRTSGDLLYFFLSGSKIKDTNAKALRKHEGGSHVCGIGSYFFNHRGVNTGLYDLETGHMIYLWSDTTYPVLTANMFYMSGKTVRAYVFGSQKRQGRQWAIDPAWECDAGFSTALIKAGNRLYAGGTNTIAAIAVDNPPRVAWRSQIEGTACRLIAADDRLFVVTLEGGIMAFGAEPRPTPETYASTTNVVALPDQTVTLAQKMVAAAPLDKGYGLVYGLDTGGLATALAVKSGLRIIAVTPDKGKATALRRSLDDAGLYGTRISVHVGTASTFQAPPYLAALTTSEKTGVSAKSVFGSMRPYGGVAFLPIDDDATWTALSADVESGDLPGATIRKAGAHALLKREGPLPDSADWTHHYGDVANTAKSDDKRVKLPLGLLWFGGNSHHDVLPRHGHGPSELVVGGRLIIQGMNMLSARDVYTGRVLWQRSFDDLGTSGVYYDESYVDNPLDQTYNQVHIAGANARGANYAAASDRVYLLKGSDCLVLNPVTGAVLKTFSLPADDNGEKPDWGYIGVYEDWLIAGSGMVRFSRITGTRMKIFDNFDTSSSRRLVIMDRHSGAVRWTCESKSAFRHNAIAVGAGKVFCIDAAPKPILSILMPKGRAPEAPPVLLALDVTTGRPVWSKTGDSVFGTWLSYSKEHDLLLQCGRASRDMLVGEPDKRMMVVRGETGAIVWDRPHAHSGPAMLHGRTIYLNADKATGGAVDLLTGDIHTRKHPLTGTDLPWGYSRTYGCNSGICSEYLLAFRSGAAGFYDLARDGGTGNFGGFKSSCTANLIAADGVLNAPDYTRTCTCTYQNQTSVALIHSPDVEMWTFNDFKWDRKPVQRVGINFGAAGDRRGDNGTLWLDYPSVGGPSPDIPVAVKGASEKYFQHHSSRIETGDQKWVGASGVTGVRTVALTLDAPEERRTPEPGAQALRIASAADDAEEAANGRLSLDSTDLELVHDKQDQIIGLRFAGVNIKSADEIKQAHLQFTVDEATSGPTTLKLVGQSIANAQPFGPGKPSLSKRKRTEASVAWSPTEWNQVDEAGSAQMSPDVAPLLREIVSQPGWVSGNAIVILIDGSGKRVAKAFDGDESSAPVLHIDTGGGSTTEQTRAAGRPYTVRLHFAEPEEPMVGSRIFDVALQGHRVLTDFDVVKTAGGRNRSVVQTFTGVMVNETLTLSFVPKAGEPLLCGIEIVAE